MQTPNRQSPIQGIIISNTKPIFIDTQQSQRYTRQYTIVSTISKLPAFQPDDKLTKILYSKFLVKGVKPINSGIMISKVKKQQQIKPNSKKQGKSPNTSKQRIVTELNSSSIKLKPQMKIQKQSGIFQITKDHINRTQKDHRPQTAFQRSQSLNQLNRPQSAAIRQSASQKKLATRPQSGDATTKIRSITAISRSNSIKNYANNRFQLGEQSENVRPILSITDSNNYRNVNYIEKNRRQASAKRQNGYITEVEVSTLNKRKESKQKERQTRSKDFDVNFDKNLIRQRVTAQQKREIQEKHKKYLNYLKENQPQLYAECLNFLLYLDQNGNKAENSIFDMGFDPEDDFSPSSKEVQQEQIKNFYQHFYNICVDVQYGIKKAAKKQIKIPQKSSNLLNIYECEQLLAIYSQIQSLRSYNSDYSLKLERVKQIIKNLQFFNALKPEIIVNLLSMQFRIQLIPQKVQVIREDSQITSIYIILNGSVSKKNKQEQDDITMINQHKMPQFLITLFDGQVFGLPSKPQDKVLHYSIETLQRSLLMILPYSEYRKALSSNQNIEDRISLLQQTINGDRKLVKEDFQIVAFQMESSTYSAQQVIYRQGENCCKLLLIASGKVAICYECFITRPKTNLDPLRKTRNQKVPNFKILSHRRKNLKNYEVVHQNAQTLTYYYCETVQEKVRGEVLNWQGFYNKALPQFICDEDFVHRLNHSIVSLHDNTKVYQLAPEKMESLPQHIFEAFFDRTQSQKGKETFKRNEKQSNKWEKFKHSLVASILNSKHKMKL